VILEQPEDPVRAGAQGQPPRLGGVRGGLLGASGRGQGAGELGVQRGAVADAAGAGVERPAEVLRGGRVAEEGERAAAVVVRVG
jgi:hypothetical protein